MCRVAVITFNTVMFGLEVESEVLGTRLHVSERRVWYNETTAASPWTHSVYVKQHVDGAPWNRMKERLN